MSHDALSNLLHCVSLRGVLLFMVPQDGALRREVEASAGDGPGFRGGPYDLITCFDALHDMEIPALPPPTCANG